VSVLCKESVHTAQETLSILVIQNRSVSCVQGKSRCFSWDLYKTH